MKIPHMKKHDHQLLAQMWAKQDSNTFRVKVYQMI